MLKAVDSHYHLPTFKKIQKSVRLAFEQILFSDPYRLGMGEEAFDFGQADDVRFVAIESRLAVV
jgi:hypothetical protein